MRRDGAGGPLAALAVGALAAGCAAAFIDWTPARPLHPSAATDGALGDYYPELATDGLGRWVCVWCAAVPTAPNRDFDIYVARSSDRGETWTEPVGLDPLATVPPEIEDDFHPHVYTDGAGHWIATWYSHDDHGGTIGADTDILVSRGTDDGATWTPSVPLNTDAATDHTLYAYAYDSEPDLAHDGSGHWAAVWSRRRTTEEDADLYIAHSTDHGVTWSAPALLHPHFATDSGDDYSARVLCDGAGHWLAVWSTSDSLGGTIGPDDEVLVARSTDGYTWTAPQPLNSDAATDTDDDKSPRIARDGAGRWVVVWYRGTYDVTDDDIMVARSDDAGATWSAPEFVNDNALTDPERDRRPVAATDGQGQWVVVWYSRNTLGLPLGNDDNVFFARSRDNAVTWSSPGVLNSFALDPLDTEHDWNPLVAYAGHGRWICVWYSKFDLGGTLGTDWDLLISTACTPTAPGDHDCDGDVDLGDVAAFQRCYAAAAPYAAPCGRFDDDENGSVDFGDFAALAGALGGPGAPP